MIILDYIGCHLTFHICLMTLSITMKEESKRNNLVFWFVMRIDGFLGLSFNLILLHVMNCCFVDSALIMKFNYHWIGDVVIEYLSYIT